MTSPPPRRFPFSLGKMLLLVTVFAVWLIFLSMTSASPGFGPWPNAILQPFAALIGLTAVFRFVLRTRPHAWLIAAIISPMFAFAVLYVVALATRE